MALGLGEFAIEGLEFSKLSMSLRLAKYHCSLRSDSIEYVFSNARSAFRLQIVRVVKLMLSF